MTFFGYRTNHIYVWWKSEASRSSGQYVLKVRHLDQHDTREPQIRSSELCGEEGVVRPLFDQWKFTSRTSHNLNYVGLRLHWTGHGNPLILVSRANELCQNYFGLPVIAELRILRRIALTRSSIGNPEKLPIFELMFLDNKIELWIFLVYRMVSKHLF